MNVALDLNAGSGGNNTYTRCVATTPGNPQAGEGLFNESYLDRNNDGTTDEIRGGMPLTSPPLPMPSSL